MVYGMGMGMVMSAQVWKLTDLESHQHVFGKKGCGWQPFLGLQIIFLLICVKIWSNHKF